jgi:hypothetical protein
MIYECEPKSEIQVDYYSKRALRMWTVNENQIAWFNSVSDEIKRFDLVMWRSEWKSTYLY